MAATVLIVEDQMLIAWHLSDLIEGAGHRVLAIARNPAEAMEAASRQQPDFALMDQLCVGVIGSYPESGPADYEVRAFVPGFSVPEDPVTGSLNAGLAQWLLGEGVVDGDYTVQQGTVLGRGGLLTVTVEDESIWVGGTSRTVVSGRVSL